MAEGKDCKSEEFSFCNDDQEDKIKYNFKLPNAEHVKESEDSSSETEEELQRKLEEMEKKVRKAELKKKIKEQKEKLRELQGEEQNKVKNLQLVETPVGGTACSAAGDIATMDTMLVDLRDGTSVQESQPEGACGFASYEKVTPEDLSISSYVSCNQPLSDAVQASGDYVDEKGEALYPSKDPDKLLKDPDNKAFWELFDVKHCTLREAFDAWKPLGEQLIESLRQAADKLDANQKVTSSVGLLGGATALAGIAMSFFPPTAPVGIAMSVGGPVAGLTATGLNYFSKRSTEKSINELVSDQKEASTNLGNATEEFRKIILDMLQYLTDEELQSFVDVIPQLLVSHVNAEEAEEEAVEESEVACGGTDDECLKNQEKSAQTTESPSDAGASPSSEAGGSSDNKTEEQVKGNLYLGWTAYLTAGVVRLYKVAPFLKYIGMTNKAIKASMIRQAVEIAKTAKKATGMTRAAAKAFRATEIRKATSAFRVAKEGVRVGAYGVAMASFGALFAIADVALNIHDLSKGSITPDSENYRALAKVLDEMLDNVEQLLGTGINRNIIDGTEDPEEEDDN